MCLYTHVYTCMCLNNVWLDSAHQNWSVVIGPRACNICMSYIEPYAFQLKMQRSKISVRITPMKTTRRRPKVYLKAFTHRKSILYSFQAKFQRSIFLEVNRARFNFFRTDFSHNFERLPVGFRSQKLIFGRGLRRS